VNLQPGHLVGTSGNVIWVTSQGRCAGEHGTPIWDVCHTTIRGQTDHKTQNF